MKTGNDLSAGRHGGMSDFKRGFGLGCGIIVGIIVVLILLVICVAVVRNEGFQRGWNSTRPQGVEEAPRPPDPLWQRSRSK